MKNFLRLYENVAAAHWNKAALSNVNGKDYTHQEIAQEVAKLHLLFRTAGLEKGDHIGIAAGNCAQWAITFLSICTYHDVVVPILPNFTPENITNLTIHADCKALFTDKKIFNKGISVEALQGLLFILDVQTGELLYCKDEEIANFYKNIQEHYALRFPEGVDASYLKSDERDENELVVINYTSGTTGNPKGIMLPVRSFSANIDYGIRNIPVATGDKILCILPLAHMFGLTFELLYPFLGGAHVYFLDKMPTPATLMKAFKEVKPYITFMVPLVMEKIINNKVLPALQKPLPRMLTRIPVVRDIVYRQVYTKMMEALGGKIRHIILGGAAVDRNVEKILKRTRLPFTVGYGMTECGPLIGYEHWMKFKTGSCGKIITPLQIRIADVDRKRKVGEIQVKGESVMLGYYKNEDATNAAFTADGWLRTGDLGYLDKAGNIFIKGRSKCMILTSNGQNIYPEEIEARINKMPEVLESLVVSRAQQLVGLVVLEENIMSKDVVKLETMAKSLLQKINQQLPKFCQLQDIRICEFPFEHTPKGSIKRGNYN